MFKPSYKIYKSTFQAHALPSETPLQRLHKSLAKIDHNNVSIRRLSVFESPAIARIQLRPFAPSRSKPTSNPISKLYTRRSDLDYLITVKVTYADRFHKSFLVVYAVQVLPNSRFFKFENTPDLPTRLHGFVENLFKAMTSPIGQHDPIAIGA